MNSEIASSDESPRNTQNWLTLMIGALGVVYGDIGTSPLYAFKECFNPHYGMAVTADNVLGLLSLFIWSLLSVVCFKYIFYVMRADNEGQGGIMALIAILMSKRALGVPSNLRWIIILTGLFGTALLYGDGVITPVISVLGALEGLTVATPHFNSFVVPAAVVILVLLFMFQKYGTARIGAFLGPMILVWFVSIAAIGFPAILKNPLVLTAFSPVYAFEFFLNHGYKAFAILGAVVLCVTGAEALYADMGHFGVKPIKRAWFFIVFPALLINYLGQGALLLLEGEKVIENPFFSLVPSFLLYPYVIIATMAAVIASQALISGVYSLTHQASQLGFLPRFQVVHTSADEQGQIYLPLVNQFMMVACVLLTLFFQKSSAIISAYGIAVTGTMATTSILFYFVARYVWKWPLVAAVPLIISFLIVDITFLAANCLKFFEAGWFPVVVAVAIFVIMVTWRRGRNLLSQAMVSRSMPLDDFVEKIDNEKPLRVSGTAVIMTANTNIAPPVLLHHYRHNQVLHENVVLLSIITKQRPTVPFVDRVKLDNKSHGIYVVVASYGYMEKPRIADIFNACQRLNFRISTDHLSFYLGRESLLSSGSSTMWTWRKKLFAILTRNAQTATASFEIPPDSVVELGMQLEI